MVKIGKTEKSLVGEFYAMAQLLQRGFIAAPTLGKAKKVDILIYDPKTGKRKLLEVKTTDELVWKSKVFGENYEWMMDEKHEKIVDENLFYCFILLRGVGQLPRFFIVPSKDVAEYVKWEHEVWIAARKKRVEGKKEVKVRGKVYSTEDYLEALEKGWTSKMRGFRIPANEPSKYEDNWSALR